MGFFFLVSRWCLVLVFGVCVCCFVLLNRYWGIVMYGPGASS